MILICILYHWITIFTSSISTFDVRFFLRVTDVQWHEICNGVFGRFYVRRMLDMLLGVYISI